MIPIKLLWSLPMLLVTAIIGTVINTDSAKTISVAPVQVERLDTIVETTVATTVATTVTLPEGFSLQTSSTNVKPTGRSPKKGYKFVEWDGDVAQIPADMTQRCPQYEAKFAEYGLPVEIFSYIAWRESRCTPTAQNLTKNSNGSSDHGLVQINSSWKTVTSEQCNSKKGDLTVLLNVDCNLKVAKRLLETSSNPLGNWSL